MKLMIRVIALIAIGVLVLTACGANTSLLDYEKIEPALIESIDGAGINRVTLTDRAFERLQIETIEVSRQEIDGESVLVVPYSAVIYDLTGGTWLYVSPEPLVFMRESISVDTIDGDLAILSEGPAVGTQVVTIGTAELYGADTGVGK